LADDELFGDEAVAGSPERNGRAVRDPLQTPLPHAERPNGWRSQCGAKTRSGEPCKRPPVAGRTRCRQHGGASLAGVCSPRFKHGRRSRYLKHLTGSLAAGYRAALADPRLLELTEDVALVTARIGELLAKGKYDAEAVAGVWEQLPRLLNLRAKLALAEQQRAIDAQALLPVAVVLEFTNMVLLAARATIRDADVLARFQDRVVAMLPPNTDGQAPPVECEAVPESVPIALPEPGVAEPAAADPGPAVVNGVPDGDYFDEV
jgi:hypothetical protein